MGKFIKGYGFYLFLLIMFLAAIWFTNGGGGNTSGYGYQAFCQDLEAGRVAQIDIYPNEEVPTGQVRIRLSDGEIKIFDATDVTKIEGMGYDKGVATVAHEIEKPSVIWQILPYIFGEC